MLKLHVFMCAASLLTTIILEKSPTVMDLEIFI